MAQPSALIAKLVDKSNNPQLGNQQAAITAVTESNSLNGVYNATEMQDALDLLGVAINELREKVGQAHGLIAD